MPPFRISFFRFANVNNTIRLREGWALVRISDLLEGAPEGGALNEGQADLWAYSAAENPSLGAYVVNGWLRRANIRAAGGDPDLRQYIRNANTGLTFSQLGTSGGSSFEVHRDGEIFGGTMWDIRKLMMMYETGGNWKRPDPITDRKSVV